MNKIVSDNGKWVVSGKMLCKLPLTLIVSVLDTKAGKSGKLVEVVYSLDSENKWMADSAIVDKFPKATQKMMSDIVVKYPIEDKTVHEARIVKKLAKVEAEKRAKKEALLAKNHVNGKEIAIGEEKKVTIELPSSFRDYYITIQDYTMRETEPKRTNFAILSCKLNEAGQIWMHKALIKLAELSLDIDGDGGVNRTLYDSLLREVYYRILKHSTDKLTRSFCKKVLFPTKKEA